MRLLTVFLLSATAALFASPARAVVRVVDAGVASLRLVYEAPVSGPGLEEVLVGLPLDGEVVLELLEVVEGAALDLTDAQVEELAGAGQADGPARIGEPGMMRDQRVASLLFAPRLSGERLQTYHRVVVDLHFTGGRGVGGRSRGRSHEEALYQGLINYQQARPWRYRRTPRAARVNLQGSGIKRVRVILQEEGIYRITGTALADLGLDLSGIEPAGLRMFYDSGDVLAQTLPGRRNQLEEQAILVEDGGDGAFGPEDQLLFAAEPVSRWGYGGRAYRYRSNLYTRDNVYWLEWGGDRTGLRAERRVGRPEGARLVVDTYRHRLHREEENAVYLRTFDIPSGYRWYWEDFRGGEGSYQIPIAGATRDPVRIRLGFLGWTRATHRFDVHWNDALVARIAYTGNSPEVLEVEAAAGAREGGNELRLVHQTTDLTRFDWYELEYGRRLQAAAGALYFDAPVFNGEAEFRISGFKGEGLRIFEVSRATAEIVDFELDRDSGTVTFQDVGGNIPRRYLVAEPSRWLEPDRLELDSPVTLRSPAAGADYVVIAHREFLPAARRLAAWRGTDDRFGPPLTAMAVDVQDVYDEFSGGRLDPMAIRSFLHYAAESWSIAPLFVTLFGDGTYDYKNNSGASGGNWIPAFQDGDSTFDEWYVRLRGDDDLPDMAIGRLSVRSRMEAEQLADKLINYDQRPEPGPWQSRVLMVADDEVNPSDRELAETFFVSGAELISVALLPRELDQVKHYIGRFALEGMTKPRARDEFVRLFNEGAVVLIYVGHGNPEVLAHEQMFVLSRDLGDLRNGGRLPFMYTAASQVGVFDDPVSESMPEALLKKPDGGVIGIISATRVGFHASNMALVRGFQRQLFPTGRTHVPVGLALMLAKGLVVTSDDRGARNVQRYSLFGDPALRLAIPPYRVELELPDTLRALQEVLVQGRVMTPDGAVVSDYGGEALVQFFDSRVRSNIGRTTFLNSGGPLFRGRATVADGQFTASFMVPRDITYKGGQARRSAYVESAGRLAATGFRDNITLWGGDARGDDSAGPEIRIGFRGQRDFRSGELVSRSPVLRASITDASGINITGETGHDIVLSIDDETIPVTYAFVNDRADYRSGVLEYGMPALAPGEYEIGLKAWDNVNNSAAERVVVRVGDPAAAVVSDLLFHPNPLMQGSGYFTFNLFNPADSVELQLFALSGKMVDQIAATPRPGYNQIEWRPAAALANGTYLYRLRVDSSAATGSGRSAGEISALQIMR